MTRNDIIVSALAQLGRGQDAQAIDSYAEKLTTYANDAILDLASVYKPVRTDAAAVVEGKVNTASLPRGCCKVLEIVQNGSDIPFEAGVKSGELRVGAVGDVDVTYQFAPRSLASPTDVPELPEYMHGLIVSYVVGRERASEDASNQRGANIYFEIYEAGKRGIRPHLGDYGSYSIVNRWD